MSAWRPAVETKTITITTEDSSRDISLKSYPSGWHGTFRIDGHEGSIYLNPSK